MSSGKNPPGLIAIRISPVRNQEDEIIFNDNNLSESKDFGRKIRYEANFINTSNGKDTASETDNAGMNADILGVNFS